MTTSLSMIGHLVKNEFLAREMALFVAIWRGKRSKRGLAHADPATIAAVIRIALARREPLSLNWLATPEIVGNHLLISEPELSGHRVQARELADSYLKISHQIFRDGLQSVLRRALSPVSDASEDHRTIPSPEPHSQGFAPSPELIEMIRDGLRSHSENYRKLLEPRFVPDGLEQLRSEEISEFVSTRMWRLMLSLADHAVAEGEPFVQLGDETGFVEKVEHLLLDRIPISPRNFTPFLQKLYSEYTAYVGGGLVLPLRGTLLTSPKGLWLKLNESAAAPPSETRRPDDLADVLFE